MTAWLEDPEIRDFLQVNTYGGVEWFNGEAMEAWLDWMLVLGAVDILSDPGTEARQKSRDMVQVYDWITAMDQAAAMAEFQVGKLLGEL